MVWKWPPLKSLETAVIPNTSNIRLIRINNGHQLNNYQYWKELEESTRFHHNFWAENNRLHSLKSAETDCDSEFYRSFSELRAKAFSEYHRETWRRNWSLLGTGYQCIYHSIRHKLSFKVASQDS